MNQSQLDFYRKGGFKEEKYENSDLAKRFNRVIYNKKFVYTNKKALSPVKLKGASFFTYLQDGVVSNDLIIEKVGKVNLEKDIAMLTSDSHEIFFKMKRDQYAFVATQQSSDYVGKYYAQKPIIYQQKPQKEKIQSIHEIREQTKSWSRGHTKGNQFLPELCYNMRPISANLDVKLGCSHRISANKSILSEKKYYIYFSLSTSHQMEDFEFETTAINNVENVQSNTIQALPKEGPYTISLKDMLFDESKLKVLLDTLNLTQCDIRTRIYEAKTGESLFTYYIEVQSYDEACTLIGTNGGSYEGCDLNTRYLPPKGDQKFRTQRKEFTFDRNEMGSQVAQQTGSTGLTGFNRSEMGSQVVQQSQGFNGFSRNDMGSQVQQQSGFNSFSRKDMGTNQTSGNQFSNFNRNQMGSNTKQQQDNKFQNFNRSQMGANDDQNKPKQDVTLQFK